MPPSTPPLGFVPIASATSFRALVARAPPASSISTCTTGDRAWPTAVVAGCTVKVSMAGRWTTVSTARPVTLSAVAVITATPLLMAVTIPVAASTVAIAGTRDCQTTGWPVSGVPLRSLTTAANCRVWPRVTSVSVPGVTCTLLTAGTGGAVGESQEIALASRAASMA